MERSLDEGVTVTVDYLFKPGLADGFCTNLPKVLPDTAQSAGFRKLKAVRHGSDPNRVLLVEIWDDEPSYRQYIAWRTERGDVAKVEELTVHVHTNVWPNFIARI